MQKVFIMAALVVASLANGRSYVIHTNPQKGMSVEIIKSPSASDDSSSTVIMRDPIVASPKGEAKASDLKTQKPIVAEVEEFSVLKFSGTTVEGRVRQPAVKFTPPPVNLVPSSTIEQPDYAAEAIEQLNNSINF
jgi:hypothetical protein